MSFLNRVAACNVHDLTRFRSFRVDGVQIGWVRPSLIERLARTTFELAKHVS